MNCSRNQFLRSAVCLLTPLFCSIAGDGILLAAEPTATQRQERIEQIRSMKPEDREELANKFRDRYKKLPQDARAEVQELQSQLEESKNAELKKIMEDLSDWLKTLSKEDRAALLRVDGPEGRLIKMRELLDKPPVFDHSKSNPASRNPPPKFKGEIQFKPPREGAGKGQVSGSEPRFGGGPRFGTWMLMILSQQDLYAVVPKLESMVRPTLSSTRQSELDGLEACPRYLKMMDFLLHQELQEMNDHNGKTPAWAEDTAKFESLIASVSDRRFQEIMRKDNSNERKRSLLLLSISSSLLSEYERKHRPSEAKLKEFMNSMPEDSRAQLEKNPDWKPLVSEMYIAGHPQDFPKYVRELPDLQRRFAARVFQNRNGRDNRFDRGRGGKEGEFGGSDRKFRN